jgi:hypothetical protein
MDIQHYPPESEGEGRNRATHLRLWAFLAHFEIGAVRIDTWRRVSVCGGLVMILVSLAGPNWALPLADTFNLNFLKPKRVPKPVRAHH